MPAVTTATQDLGRRQVLVKPLGKPTWIIPITVSGPLTEAGSTLLYQAHSGELLGARSADGRKVFTIRSFKLFASRVLAVRGSDVLINARRQLDPGGQQVLMRVDLISGKARWITPVLGKNLQVAASGQRAVVIEPSPGSLEPIRVRAFDLGTGTQAWERQLAHPVLERSSLSTRVLVATSSTYIAFCS